MGLRRSEILKGTYTYPKSLIRLRKTNHFIERLEQRGIGLDCIPTMVRITPDNIYCGEEKDGKLESVVVRLSYNSYMYIFLCFTTKWGVLKTVWFKRKKAR